MELGGATDLELVPDALRSEEGRVAWVVVCPGEDLAGLGHGGWVAKTAGKRGRLIK
jgi:hypothetical protein